MTCQGCKEGLSESFGCMVVEEGVERWVLWGEVRRGGSWDHMLACQTYLLHTRLGWLVSSVIYDMSGLQGRSRLVIWMHGCEGRC
jgi:hypothetical protein